MIIVVTGLFDEFDIFGHKTGKKVFGVSHGVDSDTLEMVSLPSVDHPRELGAVFNDKIEEWVIYEKANNAV